MRLHPMRGIVCAIILVFLGGMNLGALDIQNGVMRIKVDENTGVVSVYRLLNEVTHTWESLFFPEDSKTSFETLNYNGQLFKLGYSPVFSVRVDQVGDSAVISYQSKFCNARKFLIFTKSSKAVQSDGVLVRYELFNLGVDTSQVGLRVLLDTWLGEKSGINFSVERQPAIDREMQIDQSTSLSWVGTQGLKANLIIQFRGSKIETADDVVLANWKRFNQNAWDFPVNYTRGFSLLPYSINDSAVALFWNPKAVASRDSRILSFYIGTQDVPGYASSSQSNTTLALKPYVSEAAAPTPVDSPEVVALNHVIASINAAIASDKDISDADLAIWKKAVSDIQEKKGN